MGKDKGKKLNTATMFITMIMLLAFTIRPLLLIAHQLIFNSNNLSGVGFSDIIEYWSAFRIWRSGGNPYDGQLMLHFQLQVRPAEVALMMWNPPWLLLLFSPILSIHNYLDFSRCWFFCSVAAYIFGALYLLKSFAPQYIRDLKLWVLLLTFAPFISALSFGQLGCWLFLGVALAIGGVLKNRMLAVAFGSILISIKPHLFAIFILSLIAILIKNKNWKVLAVFCLAPILLATVTELASSDLITLNWLRSMCGIDRSVYTIQPQEWLTTTLPSILCAALSISSPLAKGIVSIISLFTCLTISICAIRKFTAVSALSICLLVSLPLSPFGWLFDYTVLSVCIIMLWPILTKKPLVLEMFIISCFVLLVSYTLFIDRLDQAFLPLMPCISVLLATAVLARSKLAATEVEGP